MLQNKQKQLVPVAMNTPVTSEVPAAEAAFPTDAQGAQLLTRILAWPLSFSSCFPRETLPPPPLPPSPPPPKKGRGDLLPPKRRGWGASPPPKKGGKEASDVLGILLEIEIHQRYVRCTIRPTCCPPARSRLFVAPGNESEGSKAKLNI